ncbi:MAG: peptidoglycan DD-metalloendopeptidase family protein [Microbacteriaceae bacterium]|nr:peptidoglycan DD-metalloendopeptidase family protein [Microbacteriaceae bacterium]
MSLKNSRRGARSGVGRGRISFTRSRLFAVVAVVALASVAGIVAQPANTASAADYPSWADVQAAQANQATKQAEVARITGFLDQLKTDAAAKQAVALQRGNEKAKAQADFDKANFEAQEFQLAADRAQATAQASRERAGQLAAKLARSGGEDVSAALFFDGASAKDLLSQLGMASKITDMSASVYAQATQDQNKAKQDTAQALKAKAALKVLANAAEAALAAANVAVDAAAKALSDQQANEVVLQAQLAVLTQNRAVTEADYNTGVAERAAAAAAAAERARLAAAAAAAAARAAANQGGGNGGGAVSLSGWVRPAGGNITSGYGMRINPYSGIRAFHSGTDLGAGCNNPIYAAHAGIVSYAGPSGGYGNFIQVTDDDGISTAYGHIVDGGILVSRGQSVAAGQQIARVGSTGNSTGCHLHFEVRNGGGTTDPVPFLAARGIYLS